MSSFMRFSICATYCTLSNYEQLGSRIKENRCKKGLSQSALAEYADVSVPYISQIETGKKKIGLERIIAIVAALNVSVDYLLTDRMKEIDLLNDCSCYEKRIITEALLALK